MQYSLQIAGPIGRAVQRVSVLPLAYWDCRFEFRRGHGCLSILSVVCIVRYRYMHQAVLSSRGVLLSVVCLSVIAKSR
jgi:hypothetical protein